MSIFIDPWSPKGPKFPHPDWDGPISTPGWPIDKIIDWLRKGK